MPALSDEVKLEPEESIAEKVKLNPCNRKKQEQDQKSCLQTNC